MATTSLLPDPRSTYWKLAVERWRILPLTYAAYLLRRAQAVPEEEELPLEHSEQPCRARNHHLRREE